MNSYGVATTKLCFVLFYDSEKQIIVAKDLNIHTPTLPILPTTSASPGPAHPDGLARLDEKGKGQ